VRSLFGPRAPVTGPSTSWPRVIPPRVTSLSTARSRDATSWHALTVSVVGEGHRAEAKGGDDCSQCLAIGESAIALVVADGAGGSSHAAWSARTAVDLIAPLLDAAAPEITAAASAYSAIRVLGRIMISAEDAVLDVRRRFDIRPGDGLTTLGVALASDDFVVYAGIGDGFLVVGLRDGRYFLPIPIVRASRHHNETWLLGHDSWRSHGFCYAVCDAEIATIALSTDGLEEVLLDYRLPGADIPGAEPLRPVPDRFSGAVTAMRGPDSDLDDTAMHLARLLVSSEVGALSSDDLSLAIAVRH